MAQIIKTLQGSSFDLNKPAFCSFITVLDDNGYPVKDTLKLTGKTAVREEFRTKYTEIEVSHSFGTDFISEVDLYQN